MKFRMSPSPSVTETVTPKPTFAEILERLWVEKHTGPVIVHFTQGFPKTVEMPSEPLRFALDSGRASLDT